MDASEAAPLGFRALLTGRVTELASEFSVSVFLWPVMASAQTVPIDVKFTLLDLQDPYATPVPPLAGAVVRLVLGESPTWQNPDAGHEFVTDANGESHFTMEGVIDTRCRSRNIGFTPLRMSLRAKHMKVAVELEHTFSIEKEGAPRVFRWMLTMDLDCFRGGPCSDVGFMGIHIPDAQGRFTRPLARQSGTESWKVPELNDRVIWGMSSRWRTS